MHALSWCNGRVVVKVFGTGCLIQISAVSFFILFFEAHVSYWVGYTLYYQLIFLAGDFLGS